MRVGRTLVVLVVLLVSVTACGAGDEDIADHNPGVLFPDRANQYREDQERRLGESARLGGYTATVTEATLESENKVVLSVEITNRDDTPQPVDSTQWTLVNPRVQTLEVAEADFDTTELAGGATVTASISFTVEAGESGDYFIQFKPEALDAARGIWRLVVD